MQSRAGSATSVIHPGFRLKMEMKTLPSSLQTLHRLRASAADLARQQWQLACERLRRKDQEIAAIQEQLTGLDHDLRRRAQAALLDREFLRLADLWKDHLQQQQHEARQERAGLQADCERRHAHLQACRLALRTLERYGERLESVQRRRQSTMQERESNERSLSRRPGQQVQPWI